MKRIFLVLVFLSVCIICSQSCGRGGSSESNPTRETMVSGGTMATTICTPVKKCSHFNDVYNSSVFISDVCAPFLNDSCIILNQAIITNLTETHESTLTNISRMISENCNCRDRSTEIFCQYLFPECSFSKTNACSDLTCETTTLLLPCSGYCNSFLNSCISEQVKDQLNKLFSDFLSTETNLTIDAICDSLMDKSCVNGTNPNELTRIKDCLSSATTAMTDRISYETTIQGSQTDSDKDLFADETTMIIILVSCCAIGVLVIVLVVYLIVRRFSKHKSSSKNPLDDNSTKTDKEVVYNALYNSVELKPENGGYQNSDLNAGIDSLYTKVVKDPKHTPDVIYTQVNKKNK